MTARAGRIADRLDRGRRSGERMLVLYVTLGDPLTEDLLLAAVAAGADAIELGIPTPRARPRGEEIRLSFERAGAPGEPWQLCRSLRARAPDVILLPLVYADTLADLGLEALIEGAAGAGMDGVVLVEPSPRLVSQVDAAGLSAIPVIKPDTAAAQALEEAASHLTYRALSGRTGDSLDLEAARGAAAAIAATARKPFILGFGIKAEEDVRALAPHAAGIVIGSELLHRLRHARPDERAEVLAQSVSAWKAAALERPIP